VARTLGGGSATVFPPYTVSPLQGLTEALGDAAEVVYAAGVTTHTRIPVARPPLLGPVGVRFLGADGTELAREERFGGMLAWQGTLPAGIDVVELTTRVRAHARGDHVLGASGLGRFALTVDGREAFDATLELPPGADIAEAHMRPPQHGTAVSLEQDQTVDVVLRHQVPAGAEYTALQINVDPPRPSDDEALDQAAGLAADADVAVVVVGTTEEVESEGFDRDSLALPGRQDELVRRVAAANARTIVVVNAGAPVLLPWADEVPAVLLTWFGGQEMGAALAEVLLGDAEPGGRLPTQWPASADGLPSTQPVDGVLAYEEGLNVGHRAGGDGVRYPFGHGLAYTTFEQLAVEPAGDGAVRVRVRNAGGRRGREVVQVYAARPDSAVERPVRWLAGFAAVELEPGEEADVEVAVPRRALAHWDAGEHAFVLEPGPFDLHAGRSSGDLRASCRFTPADAPTNPRPTR